MRSEFGNWSAVLLDFDGTLVDTEPLHFKANSMAFEAYGHRVDESEYYLHWSQLGEGAAGEIRRHKLRGIDPKTLKRNSRVLFSELIRTVPIPELPGAGKLLARLAEIGCPSAIASNTPREFLRIMLARAGLPMEGLPIIGGSDDLRGKPHPDIFLKAIHELGVEAAGCLIVEDTWKGLQAARRAGCQCVIVRPARLPAVDWTGALAVLDSLSDVVDMLDR